MQNDIDALVLVNTLKVIMSEKPDSYGKDKGFAEVLEMLNAELIMLFKKGCRFEYHKMKTVPFPAASTINRMLAQKGLESKSYEEGMYYIYTASAPEFKASLLKKLYVGYNIDDIRSSCSMILNLFRTKYGMQLSDEEIMFMNHLSIQCMLGLGIRA